MSRAKKDRLSEEVLFAAIRAKGWMLPETEEEVAASEQDTSPAPEVPPVLRDPYAVFSVRDRRAALQKETPPSPEGEVVEEWRRAARHGQEIPDEIEERMDRDREAAESDDE